VVTSGSAVRLRFHLLVLVLAALLPLVVFSTIAVALFARNERAAVERGAIETARAVVNAVDRELAGSVSTLEALATSGHLDIGDLDRFAADARRVLATQEGWRTIILATPQGRQLVNLAAPAGAPLPAVAEPASFAELLRTGKPVVGNLAAGPAGEYAFPVRVPVARAGRLRYVLSAVVQPSVIADILTRQRVPEDWVGTIVDRSGVVVARSRAADRFFGRPASDDLRRALAASSEGWFAGRTLEGWPSYAAYSQSPWSQWSAGLGIPADVVEASLRRSVWTLIAGGLAFVGLGVVLALAAGRRIAGPIQTLVRSAEALGRGEPITPPPASHLAEMEILSRAIEAAGAAAVERRRADEERRESEKLIRAVLEGTEDAVFLKDRDGRYLMANPAGCHAIGRPLAEILGKDDRDLFPEEVARVIREHDRLVMETGETHRYERTADLRPAADVVRTYLSTKSPRLDPEGRVIGVISISRDITDRKRADQERDELLARERLLRAEAERANRSKDEFLAMLGHELRNPLGAIANAVAALEGLAGKPDETVAPLRDIIGRQTSHLTRLVNDLLDVSRVTSGKVALVRAPIDLHDLAERCLAALHQTGLTTRHQLTLLGEPVVVDGDPTRLEQILVNLVDNAVKYTPPGGQVVVTVAAEGNEAVLRVRDSGVGMSPEVLPHIFDMFVQGERSLDRPPGGLGLGLTLIRRLVELHGGHVTAWSAGPGQGSEFAVHFPRADRAASAVSRPADPSAQPPRRVVVVEDHQDAREGLRLLLELWGHSVEEASDGEQGLELILAARPDVALLDLGLPGRDGYAVARAIRAAAGGDAIYLVALTGYGQIEDRRRVEAAGFDAHLVKPVDAEALARVLSAVRVS
jgi:PAS domain S-box-containing protein